MLHSNKQQPGTPLYVAGNSINHEHILSHILWRLIGETGLIHIDQLTQMETVVISKLLKKKYHVANAPTSPVLESELNILRSAVDKIIMHVGNLHDQSKKYHFVVEQNRHPKPGQYSFATAHVDSNIAHSKSSPYIDRPIDEIGLSARTSRLLKSAGIKTLEQLRRCSLPGLRSQARFGVKTIHELETILSKYDSFSAGASEGHFQ